MLKSSKKNIILGVDEVGRGSLAGPVVAAAVILPGGTGSNIMIKDSKKIPVKKIVSIAAEIRKIAVYAIGMASVEEINEFNILEATMLAMRRAIFQVTEKYDILRVDGNHNPLKNFADFKSIVETVINGDNLCQSIAAASIVAKSYRDELMKELHTQYPLYYWDKNKGYGTKKHLEAINKYGLSIYHRTLFCVKF